MTRFGLGWLPLLPAWALWAMAALCTVVVTWAAVRRAPGAIWRAVLFALLLATLAGPRLERAVDEALPDIVLLGIDRTASMRTGARTTLAAAAEASVRAQVAAMPGVELRTVELPEGGRDGTRLFAALDGALAAIPAAQRSAVLAITDGQVHDRPAGDLGAPFHALLTARGEEHDRRIRLTEAPEYAVVGKSADIRGVVEDLGPGPPAATVTLTLRHDDAAPLTQVVQPGVPWTIHLSVTREGPSVIEIAASPWDAEASGLNNRVALVVHGVRDRLRVLLVSGQPNPGERTWRRLLRADPAVDLVHFTILRTAETDDLTPLDEMALIAFPTRELFQEKINQFDLIIFDRVGNRGYLPLPYLGNVAGYVEQGGALLVEVGPEFASPDSLDPTPLGRVLPAHAWPQDTTIEGFGPDEAGPAGLRTGAFRPTVTPLGTRHPVTAGLGGAASWGPWYRRIVPAPVTGTAAAGGAVAVMADPGPAGGPLLLLDHVGRGRVAMLLSDQAWLWARGHDGGGPQSELLRRVAHWLMRQPELEEERLTATLPGGSMRIERHTLSDAPPPDVAVTAPDGTRTMVRLHAEPGQPGVATAEVAAAGTGVWRVGDGSHTAFAATGADNPRELADLRATATLIGPIAKASGGGVLWLAGIDGRFRPPALRRTEAGRTEAGRTEAGDGWIGLLRRAATRTIARSRLPLLPPALLLPILLVTLVAAWLREAGVRGAGGVKAGGVGPGDVEAGDVEAGDVEAGKGWGWRR